MCILKIIYSLIGYSCAVGMYFLASYSFFSPANKDVILMRILLTILWLPYFIFVLCKGYANYQRREHRLINQMKIANIGYGGIIVTLLSHLFGHIFYPLIYQHKKPFFTFEPSIYTFFCGFLFLLLIFPCIGILWIALSKQRNSDTCNAKMFIIAKSFYVAGGTYSICVAYILSVYNSFRGDDLSMWMVTFYSLIYFITIVANYFSLFVGIFYTSFVLPDIWNINQRWRQDCLQGMVELGTYGYIVTIFVCMCQFLGAIFYPLIFLHGKNKKPLSKFHPTIYTFLVGLMIIVGILFVINCLHMIYINIRLCYNKRILVDK